LRALNNRTGYPSTLSQLASVWHQYFQKVVMKKCTYYFLLSGMLSMGGFVAAAQGTEPESVQPQSDPGVSRVTINPNPVHGNSFFYVQVDSCLQRSMDSLILYNSGGYIMQNKTIELQQGDNRILVNIAGINPGFYTLRLIGRNIPHYSLSRQIMIGD
jgi:hypothetical protein